MESFECQANRSGLDGVGMLYHRRFSPSEYHDQSLLFYAVFNLVFEPQVQIAYCISFSCPSPPWRSKVPFPFYR